MYQISRAIYRELAAEIIEDRVPRRSAQPRARARACEAAIQRLATDRHYFARPSRTLFNDIRIFFPMSAQLKVYRGRRPLHDASPASTSRRPTAVID